MRETWQGIDVHRSWLFTSQRRGFAPTLLNNLTFAGSSLVGGLGRTLRPDVLVASGPPYFSQFSGALLAAWHRVPLVLDVRDLWPDYLVEMGTIRARPLVRAMYASERWLLGRAKAVVVVTPSFRARLVEKGVPAEAMTVVPNGVDVARFYPDDEPPPIPALARRTPEERIVGYLGTFGAGQGLHAVLDAARALRGDGVPTRVVLVGDGSERAGLEERLRDAPIEGVSIHPPIPRDHVRAFYNACDAVLVPHASLPILGDTVPSKIFEIMACARPLVAALRGEGARLIAESGGGELATPGDGASIADAVRRLFARSAAERAVMGTSGRAYALHNYDRRTLGARYLDLLERTAGHVARGAPPVSPRTPPTTVPG
jgi:glycosyltransferase involved in cell wall biosynthesis